MSRVDAFMARWWWAVLAAVITAAVAFVIIGSAISDATSSVGS